ncbi:hypothetical protein MCOR25_002724 [Pyricularia grisea]|nr:hypothetical protein MCOR25_002724 [Pyricularia grisea]
MNGYLGGRQSYTIEQSKSDEMLPVQEDQPGQVSDSMGAGGATACSGDRGHSYAARRCRRGADERRDSCVCARAEGTNRHDIPSGGMAAQQSVPAPD